MNHLAGRLWNQIIDHMQRQIEIQKSGQIMERVWEYMWVMSWFEVSLRIKEELEER